MREPDAPVNDERGPGDVLGGVGEQVGDGVGDLLGRTDAAKGITASIACGRAGISQKIWADTPASTTPGGTAFTRIPYGASSRARH